MSADKKRRFTWQELSLLNTECNAHIAIRGKVYDVSKFLARHPGGRDVLLKAAGRDVTPVFESYHVFTNAPKRYLEKFYVGEMVSNEFPSYPEPGPFFKTVKKRVEEHFRNTKQDPKFSRWMWLRYILFPTIVILTWYLQVFKYPESFPVGCGLSVIGGWFTALVLMANVHDACHFAITKSPLVWRLIGALSHDFLGGCSIDVWTYQHVFGHHPYTNVDGADPDIHTSNDSSDIRRIKWTQNWIPYYFYQHIFIPPIYCLLGMKTHLQDFKFTFFTKGNSTIRYNPPTTSNTLVFLGGKLVFFIYRIVIPSMLLPVWKVLVYFCIVEIVTSYWLALIFQVSHVVGEVDWPQPDKDGKIAKDWAELQIQTTLDYDTDSWFWNTFTGALNHQTAHHLFPGVSQFYYPQITPIVRETCKKFGVRYNYMPTFLDALACHVGYLKRLGQHERADQEMDRNWEKMKTDKIKLR